MLTELVAELPGSTRCAGGGIGAKRSPGSMLSACVVAAVEAPTNWSPKSSRPTVGDLLPRLTRSHEALTNGNV